MFIGIQVLLCASCIDIANFSNFSELFFFLSLKSIDSCFIGLNVSVDLFESGYELLRRFLEYYTPEAFVCNQMTYGDMRAYFSWMVKLSDLESDSFNYLDYIDEFESIGDIPQELKFDQRHYLISHKCRDWDYRTCLAYIVFLQRKSHWDEGYTHPHAEQCMLGGVRNVLLHMSELLSQN